MVDNLQFHKPVLLAEVLENLAIKDGEIYVDGTFGAGGYCQAILTKIAENGFNSKVFGVDRDDNVLKFSENLQQKFPNNFEFLLGNFSQIKSLLAEKNINKVDAIILDLGVSSMQFDENQRGFSFNSEEKLDMRMNQKSGLSAFELVNNYAESDLTRIIKDYGEERKAKAIARKIVEKRQINTITSCKELADIIRSFYRGYFKTDPATKTFQALRIYVNKELEELVLILEVAKSLLNENGRLIVVSFHSLEDKIVKDFLKKESGLDIVNSRYLPPQTEKNIITFRLENKAAIKPTEEEINNNIRSRSSKMRIAYKT